MLLQLNIIIAIISMPRTTSFTLSTGYLFYQVTNSKEIHSQPMILLFQLKSHSFPVSNLCLQEHQFDPKWAYIKPWGYTYSSITCKNETNTHSAPQNQTCTFTDELDNLLNEHFTHPYDFLFTFAFQVPTNFNGFLSEV